MESVHQNCTPSMVVTKTWTGLGLDWSNSSPLNISSIWHRIFKHTMYMSCDITVIACIVSEIVLSIVNACSGYDG